jgi:hypothetical protein
VWADVAAHSGAEWPAAPREKIDSCAVFVVVMSAMCCPIPAGTPRMGQDSMDPNAGFHGFLDVLRPAIRDDSFAMAEEEPGRYCTSTVRSEP